MNYLTHKEQSSYEQTHEHRNHMKVIVVALSIIGLIAVSQKVFGQDVSIGAYNHSQLGQNERVVPPKNNPPVDKQYISGYQNTKEYQDKLKAQQQYDRDRAEHRPDRQYSVYAYPVYVPVPMPSPDNTLPIYIYDQYGNQLDSCPSQNIQFTQITNVQGVPLYWNEVCYL